ncbi:MAG: class I SAM-dependent methyltransferase, partial [Chloroflexota bacterium]
MPGCPTPPSSSPGWPGDWPPPRPSSTWVSAPAGWRPRWPRAGRLAALLAAHGIELVGVDAHPGMLESVRRRLPGIELHRALIEELDLRRRFDLVIGPSGVLGTTANLHAAARHLAPGGRVGLELMNPHWLLDGDHPAVRVLEHAGGRVRMEVDYPGGYVQEAETRLVWPEQVEDHLVAGGLRLAWMGGGDTLAGSPTYMVL